MGILKSKKYYLTFLLPGLCFYLFSVFYPILESLRLSMYQWNGIKDWKFIGIQNYEVLYRDRVFWIAVINNLKYLAIVVGMQVFIGLLVAIMLTGIGKSRNLIKTLYYIPSIITTIAISQLFRSIYSIEPMGLLNILAVKLSQGQLVKPWLSDIHTVLPAVSIPEGWRFIGLYMVIFYSALIALSNDVIEAGRIDGANQLQLLLYIKIPMIIPVIRMSLIMCLTGALRGFDIPFLLTNGGPGYFSELTTTYMYKKAFSSLQFGYGSSIAVFIVLESFIVVWLINLLYRNNQVEE